jgi:hypothetical protein
MMAVASGTHRLRESRVALFALLTSCFAGATLAVGWWGVPVVGLAWGAWSTHELRRRAPPARFAAASAVAAWVGLMLWNAIQGPVALLSTTLGAVFGVPGPILIVITLLFGAVLAWSGAAAASTRWSALDDPPA